MQTENRNRKRRIGLKPALAAAALVAAVAAVPAFAASVPTVTQVVPAGPPNDNPPEVRGTADGGSTVALYTPATCSGVPTASGTATTFTTAGIGVNVQDDTSTTFHAKATDANGTSACS